MNRKGSSEEERLSATKRELLAYLLEEEGIQLAPGPPPLQKRGRNVARLSFGQQRLWFLNQLVPGSALYNIPVAVRLAGKLDVEALQTALTEVVRRHDALRTTFSAPQGQPLQMVGPARPVIVPVVDLSPLDAAEQEAEVERLASAEARTPFDLASGPLLRAKLLRLSDTDHVLLFTMYHIVSDGWSMGVLVHEVAALYAAFAQGLPSPLAELPLQYTDYAEWQREWLQGDVLEGQLAYWRRQLSGTPPVPELPSDQPRPRVQSFRGATLPVAFSPRLTQELNALSRVANATLFMTLLAALNVLLCRYHGETDLMVGSPVANRPRPELEPLIGFFVNTLVLRTDLSGNPSFRQLLARVRETTLGAYAHQDLPFEKLVEELHPDRDLSRAPLFQVLFVLQNTPARTVELPGLTLTVAETSNGATNFDLMLSLEEFERGLRGVLEYNTDIFAAPTIRRLLAHFERLLEGIVRTPEQAIAVLPLLTTAEERQLLFDWNETAAGPFNELCFQQLFEQQAARTPDQTALMFESEQLSYRELNARANQVAHYLRARGVGPEVVVGVFLERSVAMLIGVLGVLKAGGTFAPLDARYPRERLSFMLADAGVKLLLTERPLLERLPPHQAQAVCLDADWQSIAGARSQNPAPNSLPANLAYVIYTSGTTGKPKAIAMPHDGFVNYIVSQVQISAVAAPARTLQFAPLSFDVSFQEIFSTWAAGATLVLISEALRRDAQGLWQSLISQRIERLFLPVVALQHLAEVAASAGPPPPLREVFAAGEQLKISEEICGLFARLPGCTLSNQYGPSETHLTTMCRLEPGAEWPLLPLIGKPTANVQVYVLDDRWQPVPIGIAGEVYIGGASLARGYLQRPEETAARFLPHPFAETPGARLYKTGDVARYRADGTLEYLGRRDQQVKIRGYRIELAEIEAALKEHPAIKEAAAAPWEHEAGHKQLAAYFVSTAEPAPSVSELRGYLRAKLPEYMLPSSFVRLEELPLTAGGKFDRRALPAPQLAAGPEVFLAPRTPHEEILAGIWAEILKVERVGLDDNFFELGGHSLLATRVSSRVRETLGYELPVRALFEAPTIAGLARFIELGELGQPAAPLRPADTREPPPLSFAQQRLWFLDQLRPGSSTYNLPLALRLRGVLNIPALEQSFNEVSRRHQILRTTFATFDGEPLQMIAAFQPRTLSVVDLQGLAEAELAVEQLATAEAQSPFDLTHGPLLRVSLLRLSDEHHVLLATLHHIIADGWSLAILVKEVAALYAAFVAGLPSPLPELPLQYAHYSLWQRQWLQGAVLEAQLAYWRQQFGALPPPLELPTDRPRAALQSSRGAVRSFRLAEPLLAGLQSLSREAGVTLFMTLLAAFQTLLARYSGQRDILVGSPIAGRNRAEIEPLIGFFVNTLVLRTDLSGALSFRDLLRRVRETALGAYDHQDVPFEKLVEELHPPRDLTHSPLFQVMFVLQNTPREVLQLPGLALSPLPIDPGTTKFDLTLSIEEVDAELSCRLHYKTELFDDSTVERMLGHYRTLLKNIVSHPQQELTVLPIVTESEMNQLLFEWNRTRTDYPLGPCLHELFEVQAERTPGAVAVAAAGEEITYCELNRRANQLAHYLQRRGVGPEALVGICAERSIELVIGVLASLKAGGGYLPLDPAWPRERLAFVLAESQMPVLLAQKRFLHRLPAGTAAAVVLIDEDPQLRAQEREANPATTVGPENIAYVIYTSGSTGRPKGVIVEHRQILNYLRAISERVELQPGANFAMVQPLTVDSSQTMIFPALCTGGTLHVISAECAADPNALGDYIRQQQIDYLKIAPSHLAALQTAPHPERLLPRRVLIVGGEAARRESIDELQRLNPHCVILNHYGPTEATVGMLTYRLRDDDHQGILPLGLPLANTQAYVVDRRLHAVPSGVRGELLIGGLCLARGYLHQPDKTAERFVPDPFSRESGARLYRTGDMVRRLADGNLLFVGRLDHQVKIRGFRIELGEIENALRQHPAVAEALVIAREDALGDKRLLAYVILKAAADKTHAVAAMQDSLKQTLPGYMLPAAILLLDTFPLSAHGKVDVQALPAPALDGSEAHGKLVPPRNAIEQQLVQIWQKVLGRREIGVTDNFFDLGGHSLLATRMMAQVRKDFGQSISLAAIFERPTIAHLARTMSRAPAPVTNASPLVAIQPQGTRPPFFCVHEIGGGILDYVPLAHELGSDQPFYGLRASAETSDLSIEAIATRYIEAIRTIQTTGPYFLGGWSFGGLVAFEMARQLRQHGNAVSLLVLIDSVAPGFLPDFFDEPLGDYSRETEALLRERLPPEIKAEAFADWWRGYQGRVEAARRFRPRLYEGRITLFKAEDVPAEIKELLARCAPDHTYGWSKLSSEAVEVHTLRGSHHTMMLAPNVSILARHLREQLAPLPGAPGRPVKARS